MDWHNTISVQPSKNGLFGINRGRVRVRRGSSHLWLQSKWTDKETSTSFFHQNKITGSITSLTGLATWLDLQRPQFELHMYNHYTGVIEIYAVFSHATSIAHLTILDERFLLSFSSWGFFYFFPLLKAFWGSFFLIQTECVVYCKDCDVKLRQICDFGL